MNQDKPETASLEVRRLEEIIERFSEALRNVRDEIDRVAFGFGEEHEDRLSDLYLRRDAIEIMLHGGLSFAEALNRAELLEDKEL